MDDIIPSPGTKSREISVGQRRFLVVEITDPLPTMPELAERLASGQPVIARSGQRGQLTSRLKADGIFTRQKTLESGWILFTPCAARKFKD